MTDRSDIFHFTDSRVEQDTDETLPDRYHPSFLSILTLAAQLNVDFLNATWQPALQMLGIGGSSQVSPSNAITKSFSFAFKRTRPREDQIHATRESPKEGRFKTLIREILVLTHPAIREHPNLTSLLGISWEFDHDEIWPVLVYPSTSHGSLSDFINSDFGKEATLEVLLRICAELALGVDALHGNNIVHGDINPNNILIHFERNAYVAKITDFDSSCICESENDYVTPRRTVPWEAPEWELRWLNLTDARRQDIYSYGLACFFTLFQPVFKNCFDLNATQKDSLSTFFKSSICPEPEKRMLDLERLIQLLTFDDTFQIFAKTQRVEKNITVTFPNPHDVLPHLERALELSLEDSACRDCCAHAAMTLAIGHQSTFFTPSNKESILRKCESISGFQTSDVRIRAQRIISDSNAKIRPTRANIDFNASWNHDLTGIYRREGILQGAERWLTEETKARSLVLGADHILTRISKEQLATILDAMNQWDRAIDLLTENIQSSQRQGLHQEAGRYSESLAVIFTHQGKWTEAENMIQSELDRERRTFREIHSALEAKANDIRELQQKYRSQPEQMAYLATLTSTIDSLKEISHDQNHLLLQKMRYLGQIYCGQGKFNLAIDVQRKIVENLRDQLGPDHLETLFAMESLAESLFMGSNLEEAHRYIQSTLQEFRRLLGPDTIRGLGIEGLEARVSSYLGGSDETISHFENLIQKRTNMLGPGHVETLTIQEDLSLFYQMNKQSSKALELQSRVFDTSKEALSSKHPFPIQAGKKLGKLLITIGQSDEGVKLISRALEDTVELFGKSHYKSIFARVALSSAYCANGRLEDAESLGNEALKELQALYGKGHALTTVALASLAVTLSAQGKPRLGLPLVKEALDISVKDSGAQSQQSTEFQHEYNRIAAEIDKEKGFGGVDGT
ncbi:hypothetical protein IQ07DRAFT_598993 [Pyrenochaeta sp. DS3sAY3a]|nr:hypothetical protein IQ07DRAFT_598993 [Pyrenochaeta sp. DS3sAY3a]